MKLSPSSFRVAASGVAASTTTRPVGAWTVVVVVEVGAATGTTSVLVHAASPASASNAGQ